MTKKMIILIGGIVLVLIGLLVLFSVGNNEDADESQSIDESVNRVVDFKVDTNFDEQYISFVESSVEDVAGVNECVFGSEVEIQGVIFCQTVNSEGAAGSIYQTYTYTSKQSNPNLLEFTVQMPQCQNYDEPEAMDCEIQQSAFNPDLLVVKIGE